MIKSFWINISFIKDRRERKYKVERVKTAEDSNRAYSISPSGTFTFPRISPSSWNKRLSKLKLH